MSRPKIELSKFYESNQYHIPVYEKSKKLQIKKQQNMETHTIQKFESELNELTFRPVVNKKTERLIDGKLFE